MDAPGDADAKSDAHAAVATVGPPPDASKSVVESSEPRINDKLASTSASNPGPSPSPSAPRLAVVTDIQIPQNFDFPTSPPASSFTLKPRYNAAVLDEFDPLASAKPASPVAPKPQTPRSGTHQDPPRPATPTSAPATIATFPTITSIARSFISRPSSPASATRPDSPKKSASALPPQSPATRTKPVQASTLSTSSTAPVNPPPDPEQFDFPRFLEQLKSRPADPVARYLRR
ncbi:hypothetical protein FRC08_001441 [Ceratobasidium sp. 394]|nr:hypothetical protein FRC08_001441 [Ceratobasidium sp. 394]